MFDISHRRAILKGRLRSKAYCLRHQKFCLMLKCTVHIAGSPCQDHSAFGGKLRMDGPRAKVFWMWASQRLHMQDYRGNVCLCALSNKPPLILVPASLGMITFVRGDCLDGVHITEQAHKDDVIIHENVEGFGDGELKELFGGTRHIIRIVLNPVTQGWPIERARQYVIMPLKTIPLHIKEVEELQH